MKSLLLFLLCWVIDGFQCKSFFGHQIDTSLSQIFTKQSRADPGCGTHSVDPTESFTIRSPFYQIGYYPSSYDCTWRFFGTSGCNPTINCESFNIADSADCKKDYFSLSDGSESNTKFCGTTGPANLTSTTSILIARFKSALFSTGKGFSCSVACAPLDVPPSSPSENLIPTSDPNTNPNCTCGEPGDNSNRIVNGTEAPLGKWRWQAAMVLRGRSNPFCGGSLINDRFILTAAHCVVTTGLVAFPAAAEVVLNEYDLSTTDETITIRRSIISVIPHPFYSATTNDYDIALLELNQPVDLTATEEPIVTPVCLPAKGTKDTFAGEVATVTGWGTTSEGGDQATKLMEVDVPVITNELCNEQYEDRITPRMICAGYPEGGRDSCQGDSGGPMIKAINGRYTELGVVSFGEGCARPEKAGVYARVTDMNDWIRMIARRGTWCQE